jgi:hypothetical protein
MSILFRCGSRLYVGERQGSSVQVQFDYVGGVCRPIPMESIPIHPDCVISESYEIETILECAPLFSASASAAFRRDLMRAIAGGLQLPESIVALEEDLTEAVLSSTPTWMPIRELTSIDAIINPMNMDHIRYRLIEKGWIFPDVSRTAPSFKSKEPIPVYMKESPFRDITVLEAGLDINISRYVRGCVLLEVDGEAFFHPVENSFFDLPEYKSDEYYFNLDQNHNQLPDPIEMLPSKVALDGKPAKKDNNYNSQPELTKVAGHFSSTPEVRNNEFPQTLQPMEHPDPQGEVVRAAKESHDVLGSFPSREGTEFRPDDKGDTDRVKKYEELLRHVHDASNIGDEDRVRGPSKEDKAVKRP